jgi:anti-sigma regulatory factor (Ser/Thr protein kinase)
MSGEDVTIAAELRIPAEPEYLSICRLALGGVAQDLDITDDTLEDMKLVLSEVCANAMQHGYPDGRHGVVTVTLSTSADRILVEVEDAGKGIGDRPTDGVGFRLLRRLCSGYRIGAGRDEHGTRVAFWHELPG